MEQMKEIRNRILEKENGLAEYACKSVEGIREKADEEDIRPMYFRDTDRIIHSFSYQRYMDKTQVFSMKNEDRISRRILHVQYVSKIARTIGRALNLNEDLIESISLGHDLGHTPFGHAGERILNDISMEVGEGYFAHNVHGVRLLRYIENNGLGLNMTLQTLDGILCHNGEMVQDIYEPQYTKTWDTFNEEFENCYTNKEQLKKLRSMTLEGCVVRISDIIGYIGKDIEDAINISRVRRDELPEEVVKVLGDNNKDIINTLILDIIKLSYGKKYLSMSKEVFNALITLKDFNYAHIYNFSFTKEEHELIENKFRMLYKYYLDDLNNMTNETAINNYLISMNEKYVSSYSNERKVLDYIAGMTDGYFLSQSDCIGNME